MGKERDEKGERIRPEKIKEEARNPTLTLNDLREEGEKVDVDYGSKSEKPSYEHDEKKAGEEAAEKISPDASPEPQFYDPVAIYAQMNSKLRRIRVASRQRTELPEEEKEAEKPKEQKESFTYRKAAVTAAVIIAVLLLIFSPQMHTFFKGLTDISLEMTILDEKNSHIPAEIRIMDRYFNPSGPIGISPGEYNTTIYLSDAPVSKIFLRDMVIKDKDIMLSVGRIGKKMQFRDFDVRKAFAIKNEDVDFREGTITAIASAAQLYECRAWDPRSEDCPGKKWKKVKDIVIGREYSTRIKEGNSAFIEVDPKGVHRTDEGISVRNSRNDPLPAVLNLADRLSRQQVNLRGAKKVSDGIGSGSGKTPVDAYPAETAVLSPAATSAISKPKNISGASSPASLTGTDQGREGSGIRAYAKSIWKKLTGTSNSMGLFSAGTSYQISSSSADGSGRANTTIINVNYTSGNYTSIVFDAGTNSQWNNISWVSGGYYQQDLPDNKGTESGPGGADMTGNVLLMHMDESSGTVSDSSGESHDGSAYGGITYSSGGKFSTALHSDGSGRVEAAESGTTSLDITSAVTMEVWVRIDSYPTTWNLLVAKTDTSSGRAYGMWVRDTGDILISYYNGAWYHLYPTGQGFTTGSWHHVVGIIDTANDDRRIYIDGALKASSSSSIPSLPANDNSVWIGGLGGSSSSSSASDTSALSGTDDNNSNLTSTSSSSITWPTQGAIDEVAIYSRGLSAGEVLNNYKRGVLKLNLTARSCDDANCSGESWTDVDDASPQGMTVANNTYFQYRFEFSTDDSGYSAELYNSTIHYTSHSPPNVTLVSPADGADLERAEHTFTCNATANAGNLVNISLYHNATGIWHLNMTNNVSGTSNETNFTLSLPYKTFAWNCYAADSNEVSGFASSNFTLTTHADTTPPSTASGLRNISRGLYSIFWNWTNPGEDDFSHAMIYANGVWQANITNTSYNLTLLSPNTTYTLSIRTGDTAGNINTTAVNATASTNAPPDPDPPAISLVSPSNYSVDIDGNVTFIFNVTDTLSNVTSCTLFFNSSADQNLTAVNESVNLNFTKTGIPDGLFVWNVNCTDDSAVLNQGSSPAWTIEVNRTVYDLTLVMNVSISTIKSNVTKLISFLQDNNTGIYLLTAGGKSPRVLPALRDNRDNLVNLTKWIVTFNSTEFKRHNNSRRYLNDILAWLGFVNQTEEQRHNSTVNSVISVHSEINSAIGLTDSIISSINSDSSSQMPYSSIRSLIQKNKNITLLFSSLLDINTIFLDKGPNLITFSKTPSDKSISSVISGIKSSITRIDYYDSTLMKWYTYNPKAPFGNTLKKLHSNRQYWFWTNQSAVLEIS